MTQIGFTLQGSQELRRALRGSPLHALGALGSGLYMEALGIMGESKAEVPVKEGVLRASGTVLQPQFSGTAVEVRLGYGGAAKAYAVIQHERTDFHHRVGKAHYLSDPMMRRSAGMQERLAAHIATQKLFPGLP